MDFGKIVDDSFEFAKEGLVGKWVNWILLIISCIIFLLILGYIMRIYRGLPKAPELNDWRGMFIDGIKLFIVGLIYVIPIVIIAAALGIVIFTSIVSPTVSGQANPVGMMGLIVDLLFGFIVLVIVSTIIGLILATAVVRFARMDRFGEAFNFVAIFAHIGKIGIVSYIIALIIVIIFIGIIGMISIIPFIGLPLLFILLPVLALFKARYFTLLYDSAGSK